jgi:hypothetical protein
MFKYLILYQSIVTFSEVLERKTTYNYAKQYANSLNKPLVVLGGNTNQIWGFNSRIEVHGCGDLCIDKKIDACLNCNYISADIREIPLPDKYAGAVFCSHILEHLPTIEDAQKAIKELNRVADALFICYPGKHNPMAWIHPDHHLWVNNHNGIIGFEQR